MSKACSQCSKPLHSDNRSGYCKLHYDVSPEKKAYKASWSKSNPIDLEIQSARSVAWAKRHPHKKNATNNRRRAAKLQRTPPWLTEVHFGQIELFYEAASALTKEFGLSMEVDHIVPLQGENVSGLHVPWNLQVITESENCKKHNKYEV